MSVVNLNDPFQGSKRYGHLRKLTGKVFSLKYVRRFSFRIEIYEIFLIGDSKEKGKVSLEIFGIRNLDRVETFPWAIELCKNSFQ